MLGRCQNQLTKHEKTKRISTVKTEVTEIPACLNQMGFFLPVSKTGFLPKLFSAFFFLTKYVSQLA